MRGAFCVFFAFLCCSLSSGTLFDDELRELTELLRLQMRCGYADRGIPILAPAQMTQKEIDLNTTSVSCQGNFTELSLIGLDSFEFYQLKWSNIFHTVKFDVNFPSLHLMSTKYNLTVLGRIFGFDISIWGDGVFNLALVDLRANGSFVVRPSSLTQGVHIKSWKVDWQIGAASSKTTGIMGNRIYTKFINDIIQEFIELVINDNPQGVSQFMEQLIVPSLNGVLQNIAWYEITAFITGLVKGVLPAEPIC